MPSLRVPKTTLSTGAIVRVVDKGIGALPRWEIEQTIGQDAMGADIWQYAGTFAQADVIAILIATGFLAP